MSMIINMTIKQTKQVEDTLVAGHPYADPDQGGGIDSMRWLLAGNSPVDGENQQWYLEIRPRRNINGVGEWTDYGTEYPKVRNPWDNLYLQPGIVPAKERREELNRND